MTPSLLCAAAEVALNRRLRLEPSVLEECARCSGQSIDCDITDLGWQLHLELMPGGVRVLAQAKPDADTRIRGSSAGLLRLLWRTARHDPRIPDEVQISGDAELLGRFKDWLGRAGFEPGEWLAPIIGDAAAYRVLQAARQAMGWGGTTLRTLALDSAEYLREERGVLARAADVEDWMRQLETLRDDVDRFDARLRRLERQAGMSAS
jgi:ubiquinone biosynthesis protein UbiJ